MKSSAIASVKNVNYLLNAKMAALAKQRGGFLGLWVDNDGFVTEGSVNNFAIVKNDKSKLHEVPAFITPPFEGILPGCTMQHMFEILSASGCAKLVQRKITLSELYEADEVLITGGDTHIFGVSHVDGQPINEAQLGYITQFLISQVHKQPSNILL